MQKWVNLGLLIAGGIFFIFFQKLIGFGWETTRLPMPQEWPVPPEALISFGITVAIVLFVRRHQQANEFLNEVAGELGKVVWPTQKETVMSTGVVVVMVAISSLILFIFDFLWGTISRGILT
ncbi:MAG: preprotein translocase subunit SecE [bacterium]|nr:preprotein translocase subunit SecE [bacterium]